MSLHACVFANDAANLLTLLRSGAQVDARGPDGFTPLIAASGLGHYHLAQVLITAGADVHALEPRMGATALHKAAQAGSPDMIDLLIEHGAFVDQQSPILGNTPLIDAVLHKHEAAVDRLLRRGARTGIANHWHQTALDIARVDALGAIAQRIEEHDRTNDDHLATLTMIAAAKRGDREEVARLIAAGAPLDEQVPMVGSLDDNYTPLGIAAREGHEEIARLLIDAGADQGRLIGLMGGMALHDATYFGHAAIVRLLTQVTPVPGLDVQGAYNGLSALHDAVWHGHLKVVRALIDAGARLDSRTHTGATPRDLALLYGYVEIADLLARAEAAQSSGGAGYRHAAEDTHDD
jgi:ankyrin repeat protein